MSDLFLQAPKRPSGISSSIAYRIRYQPEGGYYRTISYSTTSHSEGSQLSYTLRSLSRDKVYTIEISMRVRYSVCSYNYAYGNYSDPVSFRTNATCKLILYIFMGNCKRRKRKMETETESGNGKRKRKSERKMVVTAIGT